MKKKYSIQVPAETKYLIAIRDFYSRCVRLSGIEISETDAAHLELAINELCENIIRHGYEGHGGDIMLKLNVNSSSINTVIIDGGKPHNLLEYDPIAKETLVEKGIRGKLGIRMIKTLCNNIRYTRLTNKNKTVLIKNVVA